MNHDRRSALQFGTRGEPEGDGVACVFIVSCFGVIVFRQQVVIQKDRVISVRAEELARARYIVCNIQMIAVETPGEPDVPARVIVKKENTNRVTVGLNVIEAELAQHSSPDTHLFMNQSPCRQSHSSGLL